MGKLFQSFVLFGSKCARSCKLKACACVGFISAHSLRPGCSGCVARVTSSSAMLVGMWRLWLRPAHKTSQPGTVLLPLQTGKQRPTGEATQAASVKSFSLLLLRFFIYFFFFSSPTHDGAQLTRRSGASGFGCWSVFLVSVTGFTST